MRREWRLAAILAALSILAKSSPPNKLFSGLVSLGKTISVNIVLDWDGVFACIIQGLNEAQR
jgi:hypothetical protein